MEDLLQEIRNLKTRAKNRRDLERYDKAAEILENAIRLIQEELSITTSVDWKSQLASELCDCYGLLGGIHRRMALESKTEEDRKLYLKKSVAAYQKGYEIEKNPEQNITNSYNMVNRLLSYIFLEPNSLSQASSPEKSNEDISYNIREELEKAETDIQEQLKEKRRGDIWALADRALVSLLLDKDNPAAAYADFNLKSPPDFAYESALSTLRPMSELDLPVTDKLKEAVKLLEARLEQLRSSS